MNNRDNTRTQSLTYDTLNRILSAESSGTQWGETFTIDAWSNLTNESGISGKTSHEGLNTSVGINNRLSGFGYDAAGNTISNGSATYVYDAENRLIATAGTSYIYDGEGERVEKCTEGTTPGTCSSGATGTLYWRGTGSETLAETDLAGNEQEEYLFFNGQRIARRDVNSLGATVAVHYYFSDHLGSHGVVENATGTACEQDIDYYPYGGQQNDYCSGSGVSQNYKFTGKERDAESGNDYFGARYYASSMGRFSSPDSVAGDPEDPQSWNLYSYVRNKPTISTDPDGHDCIYADGNGGGYVQRGDCTNAGGKDDNGVYVDGTIDVDSFKYNASNNSSSFSFTPYDSPTGTIGTGVLQGPNLNNGFEPGSLGAAVFGAQNNATWANASNGVNTVTAGYAAVYAGAACYFACPAAAAAVGRWGLQRLAMGASSPALLNLINRLYQAQDEIPGGTAGAVRNEVSTGEFINGGHSIKAQEMITALTKLINSGELSGSDQMIAGHIISDLKSSLGK